MTDSVNDLKPDLEHDLKASDQIRTKVQDPVYAQHLYAALCNNQFQRRDFWPVLSNQTWSCSWRYAGGIVAELRGSGDYMSWYCSGIGSHHITNNDFNNFMMVIDDMQGQPIDEESPEHQEMQQYVGEGTITEQIADDFGQLNWYPLPPEQDNTC